MSNQPPTDVVERAKAALEKPCHCYDCGDEDCGWQRYDHQQELAELVPELVAEVERLRAGGCR